MPGRLPPALLAGLFRSFLHGVRRRKGAFLELPEDDAAVLSWKWADIPPLEAEQALSGLGRMLGLEEGSALPGVPRAGDTGSGAAAGDRAAPVEARVGDTMERLACAWESGPRRLTFMTSGSTGSPRACRHSLDDMLEECAWLSRFFSGTRAFLSAVPCHHLYGFTFGLLLPYSMGLPVRRTLPLPTVLAGEMRRGDAVAGIPALWGAMNLGAIDGRGLTAISATAPISSEVLEGLAGAGFALVDIFGSSETSVAGIRTGPGGTYGLPPCFSRPDGGTLVRRHADGTETAIPLSDRLEWQDGRSFLPAGRLDRAVQVGGINVFPPLIERKLKEIPGVSDCRVRLMRPEEGCRLKAFVVPRAGEDARGLRALLRAHVRRELPPEERPVSFTFGPSLPKNEMGKDADWEIRGCRQADVRPDDS